MNYKDGRVRYIEVKFKKDLKRDKKFKAKRPAVEQAIVDKGFLFEVLTEDEIRQQPLYENLVLLWASHDIAIDTDFLLKVVKTLDSHEAVSISQLLSRDNFASEFEQVYRLIFERRLITPLDSEFLSIHSSVRYSGKSYECYL